MAMLTSSASTSTFTLDKPVSQVSMQSADDTPRRGVEPVQTQRTAAPVARLPDGTIAIDLDVAKRELPRSKARQEAESRSKASGSDGDITFVPYSESQADNGQGVNLLLLALLGYGTYKAIKGK